MTITEAAACGTPAVVTDIAGHRDAVRNGVSGVLVPVERLDDAIAKLLTDEGQRKRLADGARQRAQALTWEATALGTLQAIAVDAHRHHPG